MSDKVKIRTSETNSYSSVPTIERFSVGLKQTTKALPFPNVSTIINQREVYEEERNGCNKYRFILTIVPYCTNILFNALTEIIKNEGSHSKSGDDKIEVITDGVAANVGNVAIGKQRPNRQHMIADTEYSSELHGGYEYHPGYDFYDNHILRNKTFKLVNPIDKSNDSDFNTLSDKMRSRNGKTIKMTKRRYKGDPDMDKEFDKHLYLRDDVYTIDESINANLTNDNGWWGFTNNTTIEAKEYKDSAWETMDISRTLNDKKSCEFVDMYPDRTLFSFNPKYNKFTHKPEYNWHVVITYPYKNDYNNELINSYGTFQDGDKHEIDTGGTWTALKVHPVQFSNVRSTGMNLLFRTFTKHNLKRNDVFYLYYTDKYDDNDNGEPWITDTDNGKVYYEYGQYIRVSGVGDFDGDNEDYYFYTSDLSFLTDMYNGDIMEWDDANSKYVVHDDVENELKRHFRIRRYTNGVKSNYYIRTFRQIPNLKSKQREMTREESENYAKQNGKFENYISSNAYDPTDKTKGRLIANEQYQMAFASNIYNDNLTQITFTDTIDVENLVDNLGRPLTRLYYTFVKNNAGHNEWYRDADYTNENVEFSHCFGHINEGFDLFYEKTDSIDDKLFQRLSSVNFITNNEDIDINYRDVTFCGDIVEFNGGEYKETVLASCHHRFNTAQRELDNNEKYSKFHYHEISTDDYDNRLKDYDEDFSVSAYSACNGLIDDEDNSSVTDYNTISRPEGYYYQAHYPIQIKEYGRINQGSNKTVGVSSAKPISDNVILIQITTKREHSVNDGDVIYVCDDTNDVIYVTNCVKVIDDHNLQILPQYTKIIKKAGDFEDKTIIDNFSGGYYNSRFNWIELCNILNQKNGYTNDDGYPTITIRAKNVDIPDYAVYVGKNRFIWRDVLSPGESTSSSIPDYVFANGHFYVTQSVNFFLHRQDPFGYRGLYFDGEDKHPYFPNDIKGTEEKESNYKTAETTLEC